MINSDLLKEKLIKIKFDDYEINDSVNAFEIALDMMQYIGSINSELRDELIYSTIYDEVKFNLLHLIKYCLI